MTASVKNEPSASNAEQSSSDRILRTADSHARSLSSSGEAYHGGISAVELERYEIALAQAIDFSSNILAHGPSPQVLAAVRQVNLAAYPDRDCLQLRRVIANRFHIDPSRILIGNGSCELIHWIAHTLIRPHDSILIVGPTFSEYHRASQLASAIVVECQATAADQFIVPIDRIDSQLNAAEYRVVWLCNPNNPTGSSVCQKKVLNWVRANPNTTFVIDESYFEFAEQAKSLIESCEPNLLVLRSMTKSYAIAGLRLGFAVASPSLILQLCRQRVPWSVSSPAQAAGIAALLDDDYYCNSIKDTQIAKRELLRDLSSGGFAQIASDANYFLLPVGNASQVRSALLREGIVVRDCSSFGLPNFLRVAVLDPVNNRRLVELLSQIVGSTEVESTATVTQESATAVTEPNPPGSEIAVSRALNTHPFDPEIHSQWSGEFRSQLAELFRLRRDVRQFKRDPLSPDALRRWIEAACLAPSVGLSQPWKFVSVNDTSRRWRLSQEFELQNQLAGQGYVADLAVQYRQLKLSGMNEAPEHLAIFVDPDPDQGQGLGRQTMPESVAYSVVAAIQNFWLAARSEGVGVGWLSILRPAVVNRILEVPKHWQLIAYLCVGYPLHDDVGTPELETLGWESRRKLEEQWHHR